MGLSLVIKNQMPLLLPWLSLATSPPPRVPRCKYTFAGITAHQLTSSPL